MQSQQCFEERESNQDDEASAGFRRGYGEHAASIAQKTLVAGISATEKILQMAAWIQDMRSQLSRKEFSAFVKRLLQWVGEEARKYLDIARTFKDFDLTRLQKLEPFTLMKLRFKRYLPVVEKLREETDITPRRVQELISELIPKQPRRKRAENEDKKKRQDYADALLERHVDCESGTFYYILREVNLSDLVGGWLKAQLKSQTIGQILTQAISTLPNEYVLSQLQELQDVVEHARSLDTENRKLMHQLQQQQRRIADLEAQLAEGVAVSTAEPANVKEDQVTMPVRACTCCELNEYLENQVSAITPEYAAEYSSETAETTDYLQSEQESEYLEPVVEDDYFVGSEDDAENVTPANAYSSDNDSSSAAVAVAAAKVELLTATESTLPAQALPQQRSNRKLQPVEILTKAGEWVGGYFVHSCIAVTNLLGQERQFTLFDGNGGMYRFLGQIRRSQNIVGATSKYF